MNIGTTTLEIESLRAQLAAKNAEIARLREQVKGMEKDAGRLDWLEQHPWYDELECFNFVDGWQTPDGKRHSAGLRAVIDATLATKKEPA